MIDLSPFLDKISAEIRETETRWRKAGLGAVVASTGDLRWGPTKCSVQHSICLKDIPLRDAPVRDRILAWREIKMLEAAIDNAALQFIQEMGLEGK